MFINRQHKERIKQELEDPDQLYTGVCNACKTTTVIAHWEMVKAEVEPNFKQKDHWFDTPYTECSYCKSKSISSPQVGPRVYLIKCRPTTLLHFDI